MHAFKSSTQDKTKYKGQKKEYIKKKKKKNQNKRQIKVGTLFVVSCLVLFG